MNSHLDREIPEMPFNHESPPQSTAASLPLELLANIFLQNKFVAHRDSGFAKEEPYSILIPAAQRASQVCKQWREAALSCPFLWNEFIYFNRPFTKTYDKWLAMLLKRCNTITAEADISFPPLPDDFDSESESTSLPLHAKIPGGWNVLFKNLHQISKLDIKVDVQDDDIVRVLSFLETRLRRPSPKLKALCFTYNARPSIFRHTRICYSLPLRFLHTESKLQSAEFYNIKITPDVARQSLSNLTYLGVMFSSGPYFPPTSTSDWLGILDAMPRLESLELCDWQDSNTDDEIDPNSPIVHLPWLQHFTLDRCLGSCVRLLGHLDFPPLRTFSFCCRNITAGPDYRTLVSHIRRILQPFRFEGHLKKVSFFCGHRHLEFQTILEPERTRHISIRLLANFEDEWDFDPPIAAWFKPFTGAEKLFIHISDRTSLDNLNPHVVRSLFMPFRDVVTLETDDLGITTLLSAWEMDVWGEGNTNDVLLPSIKNIESPAPQALWPRILDFVRTRRGRGHGIDLFEVWDDRDDMDFGQNEEDEERYEQLFDAFCRELKKLDVRDRGETTVQPWFPTPASHP